MFGEGFTYAFKNSWQSGKRHNGVSDRLYQTKYYFQKAKKLFKKALTNFSEYDKTKPLTKMRSWKLNRCNCVPMLSAAEHSYFGWSIWYPTEPRTPHRPRRVRAVSAPKRQKNGTDEQPHRNRGKRPVWRNLPHRCAEATHNRIAQGLPPLYSPLGRVRASHLTGQI